MEMGNIMFGNSRGDFEVPRDTFQHIFHVLIEKLEPDNYDGHPKEFENDVFRIFPYYWGECTCGWDDLDNGHEKLEKIEHNSNCIYHEYMKCAYDEDKLRQHNDMLILLKSVYEKRGLSTEGDDWWNGCGVICDCDFDIRYQNILSEYCEIFGNDYHKDDCKLVIPNFTYKSTGFTINWYKYPMRDSYMNQNILSEEFQEIINNCINTLNNEKKD